MRALKELLAVIVAGFVAFFGGILFLVGLVFLWICGGASALLLMVSAYGAVMYAFTRGHHAGVIALVYLVYAAVPFVVAVVISYYWSKFTDPTRQRSHASAPRIRGLRLVKYTDFDPTGIRPRLPGQKQIGCR
ncbi:MAG: hypothetical protein INR62_10505 [Rhodospirillales bacterium]|nr:hypothetical protein [Acetobacter sp.]